MKRQAKEGSSIISAESIEGSIFVLRHQRVMLSMHLAELYGVEPKALMQAVKRNIRRFPDDFMFQLTAPEFMILKSQIVTSSWGGLRRARHMHLRNKVWRCSQASCVVIERFT